MQRLGSGPGLDPDPIRPVDPYSDRIQEMTHQSRKKLRNFLLWSLKYRIWIRINWIGSETLITVYVIFSREKSMYLQTCGSFESANHKKDWVRNRKSAKCHICGRSANLITSFRKFADFRFAEVICGPPTFALFTLALTTKKIFPSRTFLPVASLNCNFKTFRVVD
jgi:hypothetical protein